MALTILPSPVYGAANSSPYPIRVQQYTFIPDSAYPAGGYAVSLTQLGFQKIVDVNEAIVTTNFTGAYQVFYDTFYNTIRYYQTPTTASSLMYEVASGTNLAQQVMVVAIYGW